MRDLLPGTVRGDEKEKLKPRRGRKKGSGTSKRGRKRRIDNYVEARASKDAFADEDYLSLYMKDISKYQPLSSEREGKLAARIRKGDREALRELVKANLRFVVSVAKNYEGQGVALGDLINEGNIGLIKAARRFDEKKNFRFISYAVWWIRQAILQALADQSRIYRLPPNQAGALHKLGKAEERLEQKLHRQPLKEEIASELKISLNAVEIADRIMQKSVSLEGPIGMESASSFGEVVEDENIELPDERIEEESSKRAVLRLLDCLEPREREILRLYYGVGRESRTTLDEIGRRLGLTRERVRQLRERAVRKLKDEAPELMTTEDLVSL